MTNTLKRFVNRLILMTGAQIVGPGDRRKARMADFAAWHHADVFDLAVSRMLVVDSRPATIVQIGANDGVRGDPFREIITRYRLSGVLVEPLPDVFQRLVRNYQGFPDLRFENAAIGPKSGVLTLYRLPQTDDAEDISDFTSFDRVRMKSICRERGIRDPIHEIRVPMLTLGELVEKHNLTHISILVMDTEGFDFQILQSLDLESVKPYLIQFEHHTLSPCDELRAYEMLAKHQYRFVRGPWDTLALRL